MRCCLPSLNPAKMCKTLAGLAQLSKVLFAVIVSKSSIEEASVISVATLILPLQCSRRCLSCQLPHLTYYDYFKSLLVISEIRLSQRKYIAEVKIDRQIPRISLNFQENILPNYSFNSFKILSLLKHKSDFNSPKVLCPTTAINFNCLLLKRKDHESKWLKFDV